MILTQKRYFTVYVLILLLFSWFLFTTGIGEKDNSLMQKNKVNNKASLHTLLFNNSYVVELTPSILVSYISQSTLSIHDKTCLFLYVYAPWSLHAVAYINSGVLQEIAKRYHSYDSNIEITAMEIYEPNDIVEKQ
ncbi:uncharacterized protein OCT59_003565 [Rhizophagus irregularis]|nr:hypothetical protein OCT59_003565 [Rhizophagus irregularis]GBC37555.2 hypothetical protein RIR_jg29776.t1 [Rhizophagus irregularis DAOM 181602=DAOM 197198]